MRVALLMSSYGLGGEPPTLRKTQKMITFCSGENRMNRVLPIAKFLAFALAAVCLIALPTLMFAQTVNSGDVTGTVTDPQGAVVSGATVTITSLTDGHTQS